MATSATRTIKAINTKAWKAESVEIKATASVPTLLYAAPCQPTSPAITARITLRIRVDAPGSCAARAPFSRLIYPVPEPGGLGVHLTLDMAGQARFGPDVEWVDHIDYAVDPARGERFYPAIRRYWPALPDGALMPSYSGMRPKIVPPAVARQDFLIQGPRDHGVDGLINLFGIESPGLTSSLAIADHVGDLAGA